MALVGLGLAWIPFMKLISGQLYQYLQSVQAYIAPPIAAVFLLGILWRRVNCAGAMAALVTGFVAGLGRLVLELEPGEPPAWLRPRPRVDELPALRDRAVRGVRGGAGGRQPAHAAAVRGAPPRSDVRRRAGRLPSSPAARTLALTAGLSLLLLATVAGVWVYFR